MANMTGLSPSTRYYYKVHSASGNESSAIFSFKTQPTAATLDSNLPELHLIYGDMGSRDAFTLCSTCTGHSLVCDKTTCASANQSAGLISEIANSNHIVHVGTYIFFSFSFFLKNIIFFSSSFSFIFFLLLDLYPFSLSFSFSFYIHSRAHFQVTLRTTCRTVGERCVSLKFSREKRIQYVSIYICLYTAYACTPEYAFK